MTLFTRRTELPEPAGYSVIDEQLLVRGDLATHGTLRVDGRVEGRLHRVGTLLVGARGSIVGDIEAREVVIAGTVDGKIVADGRVEIQPTGSIRGDVAAARMLLHDGGAVLGHLAVACAAPVDGSPPALVLAPERVRVGTSA